MAQELNVVEVYNDLHKTPELGFQEFKTSAYIAQKLKEMGYEVTTGIGKTGVVAIEKGAEAGPCVMIRAEAGPCVMIRADMDALPFKVNGEDKVIHACGHDSHCAMLLAIASRLQGKIKRGTLKLLFQPGEETLKGALSVIDDGVLEDVDIALGLHIRPATDIPDGTVAAALMHSASIFVRIDVEGLSSHASRPHLGVNCAEMLAAIVQNAGLLKFAPTLTWSMKCTKIDVGGAAINVIPDKGYCMYDVRAQTNPLMKDMLEKLEKSAQSTAAAFGGKAKMTLLGDVIPACEYDDELVKEMSDCIAETLGADKLRATSIGGGEDFHFFKIKKPSLRTAYIGVGAGATPGLHHPDMKLNPESLINGVKVMEAFALKYLG